ncbi:MAG: Bifunctional NAD(P)H-hydrate repair enzyme Nnr [Candidatus Omnitrophica bacterium ADurb.Bin292]|jgi:NAD(P)H-hydrate epimerase|nr:MAG: Bifunctional NAD(P)H-hydrate repair enzyme Nnr [Candidatus Omnitrophica bacterium ADurb.Bin292]HPW76808.1 NAD(P)H-hydrate epimerase [Candidatus Omnitrophota bacterium]HQB12046.1 NAD(P)H-hydrate epimerase [Candidatus Omnitrophota bacterium]
MKAVTAEQMRWIDRQSAERFGVDSRQLMENAGRAVADLVAGDFQPCPVLVVAGKGNNAGDGFVAARYLSRKGFKVEVLLLANPELLSGASAANYQLLSNCPVCFHHAQGTETAQEISSILSPAVLLIDAIWGVGFRGRVEGFYVSVIQAMNASGRKIYSIDIPSGLHADTGKVCEVAVKADVTLALGLPKAGFYLEEGPFYSGDVRIVSIGHPESLLQPFLN